MGMFLGASKRVGPFRVGSYTRVNRDDAMGLAVAGLAGLAVVLVFDIAKVLFWLTLAILKLLGELLVLAARGVRGFVRWERLRHAETVAAEPYRNPANAYPLEVDR